MVFQTSGQREETHCTAQGEQYPVERGSCSLHGQRLALCKEVSSDNIMKDKAKIYLQTRSGSAIMRDKLVNKGSMGN